MSNKSQNILNIQAQKQLNDNVIVTGQTILWCSNVLTTLIDIFVLKATFSQKRSVYSKSTQKLSCRVAVLDRGTNGARSWTWAGQRPGKRGLGGMRGDAMLRKWLWSRNNGRRRSQNPVRKHPG